MVRTLLFVFGAYLLGAIPTAYLLARWLRGVDLRQVGSGNVGGSNLRATVGTWATIAVGLFDIAKGALPVWLAQRVGLGETEAVLAPLKERQTSLRTQLWGSGAVAQGDQAKAAGERSIVADTIHGSVVTGNGSQVVQAETYIARRVGGQANVAFASLLLTSLIKSYRVLSLEKSYR